MAVYKCKRCQYIYNEEHHEKKFKELTESDYKCPRCRCTKKMFTKISD